jgi:RNA recognition motif-containing protein
MLIFIAGFITNQMFDTPKQVEVSFDSSLPPDHYPMKRKADLRNIPLDSQYTLRVDDLAPEIRLDISFWLFISLFSLFSLPLLLFSKEKLEEVFSEFGEVSSIYYPMDLKAMQPKGFAFVRYLRRDIAERAQKAMNDTNLGVGRNIQVEVVTSKTYLSQDETDSQHSGRFV